VKHSLVPHTGRLPLHHQQQHDRELDAASRSDASGEFKAKHGSCLASPHLLVSVLTQGVRAQLGGHAGVQAQATMHNLVAE
jgi:hypothetical protein